MKNALIFLTLLGLGSSSAIFAAEQDHGHDHEEDALDFSGMDFEDDEHSNHGKAGHEEESNGYEKEEHGQHDGGDEHGHDEASTDVELNDIQLRMAGVKTLVVKHQPLGKAITSPGEIMLNAYRTTRVTPRIPAQVMKRHVRLGDHVKEAQPLVSLSSVEMAEAQGVLMEANVSCAG